MEDIIAFKKDPENSVIENLKEYSQILQEKFNVTGSKNLSKYFEDEENIEKINLSEDATK